MEREHRLANAEDRARECPDSFHIPSLKDRRSRRPDDLIKLIFECNKVDGTNGERMWVRVKSVKDGRYVGILENTPVVVTDIKHGDEIEFGPEHISSIE